jgi:hypothetical protein
MSFDECFEVIGGDADDAAEAVDAQIAGADLGVDPLGAGAGDRGGFLDGEERSAGG